MLWWNVAGFACCNAWLGSSFVFVSLESSRSDLDVGRRSKTGDGTFAATWTCVGGSGRRVQVARVEKDAAVLVAFHRQPAATRARDKN